MEELNKFFALIRILDHHIFQFSKLQQCAFLNIFQKFKLYEFLLVQWRKDSDVGTYSCEQACY